MKISIPLLDSVMPEDRGRLAEALAEQSLLPQTEIEYRVMRPDHSMRWIRTRMFPVQTKGTGCVPARRRFAGYYGPEGGGKSHPGNQHAGAPAHRPGRCIDSLLQQLTGIAYDQ